MSKLRETLLEELSDILDAEKQIIKALPKMAKAAEHEDLKRAFEMHLEETEGQVERLERIFELMGENSRSKKCKGVQGIIKEGEEMIKEHFGDAGLIASAQKVEHYEIASYGSVHSWARLLGEDEVADLLEETLDEEESTDEKLTQLAESAINVEEKDEQEDEKAHAKQRGR